MTSSPPVDRETTGRQLAGDVGEDRRDALAGEANRTDRDERDERDEQRVLEQVLALFVANRLHEIQQHRH
jgi:hypothetical protein